MHVCLFTHTKFPYYILILLLLLFLHAAFCSFLHELVDTWSGLGGTVLGLGGMAVVAVLLTDYG